MNAIEKYENRAEKVNSLLCVGLDPEFDKIPERFRKAEFPQFEFNKWIIDQTHEFVSAYKPNTAFYEARGDKGLLELKMTADYLRDNHPDIFTICDTKRADIANTSRHLARAVFDWLGFDAITLNPYMGRDALQPFLDYKDKGCIILCRTTNQNAPELQGLLIGEKPLWQIVAEKVVVEWNDNGNCLLFMGATWPDQMSKARKIAPRMTFLAAGVDAQGGKAEEVLKAGLDAKKRGLIVSSSRGIIFSENPQAAARSLRDEINSYRN